MSENSLWCQHLRKPLFSVAHSLSYAGHLGVKKTTAKLVNHFYWPNMGRDVTQWCRQCHECQVGNRAKRAKAPLMPLPTIEEPWQRVAIDIVGPLQRTDRGYRYILTIMDFGTRYPEAVPLKRIDAPTVCEELMTVFTRFGFPQEILSDRGSNFTSKVTKALLEQIKVSHLKTSPYHPQSNGMLERFHATLKSMLRKTCPQPKEWDKWLPYLLFAYRESPHSPTGFSPFELLFGREVRGPLMIVKEQWKMKGQPPQLVIDYVTEVQQRLLDTSKLAGEVEKKWKDYAKRWYDKKAREDPIDVGEEVLVLLPEDSTGVSAKWHGPYIVQEKPSALSYKIATPNRGRKTRQFHRNLLKRYIPPVEVMQVMLAEEEEDEADQLELIHLMSQEAGQDESQKPQPHLDQQQQEDLQQVLEEFADVFSEDPGLTERAIHHIHTGTARPTCQQPYRVPVKWQQALETEVQHLLEKNIIAPSSSPWSAPVVCVRKKDSTLRMCVDFRKLNSVTEDDIYPMKRIEEMIDAMGEAQFISTIDLSKSYYQIPVAQEDQRNTRGEV